MLYQSKKAAKAKQIVGISDMKLSKNPDDQVITYSLGSCLGVVLYDKGIKAAALLHVMLPDSSIERVPKDSSFFNSYKFVDTGIPKMIEEFQKLGAAKGTTKLAVFGGARVFKSKDHFNIGKRNYVALRKTIWKFGLLIAKEHVGGDVHRTVSIDVETGIITLDVNKQETVTYQL